MRLPKCMQPLSCCREGGACARRRVGAADPPAGQGTPSPSRRPLATRHLTALHERCPSALQPGASRPPRVRYAGLHFPGLPSGPAAAPGTIVRTNSPNSPPGGCRVAAEPRRAGTARARERGVHGGQRCSGSRARAVCEPPEARGLGSARAAAAAAAAAATPPAALQPDPQGLGASRHCRPRPGAPRLALGWPGRRRGAPAVARARGRCA